jgi:hypothetical protein
VSVTLIVTPDVYIFGTGVGVTVGVLVGVGDGVGVGVGGAGNPETVLLIVTGYIEFCPINLISK